MSLQTQKKTKINSNKSSGGQCCNSNSHKLCSDSSCIICFNRSLASYEKSNLWSNRNKKTPRNVLRGSHKKYWISCDKCSHDFEISCDNFTKGRGCPYCSNKKLCSDENCQTCFDKSLASYYKSNLWSNRNNTTPRNVFRGSYKKYWMNCDKCNHDFEISCLNCVNGCWCPYCSNSKLCSDENCHMCFNNSFANTISILKCLEWSNKNIEKPRDIFKNTHNSYIFNCKKCNHEIEYACYTVNERDSCPYCSNRRLCSDENCQMCFNNSFASHPKAEYWSDENKKKPREVFKSCNKKFKFNCDDCDNDFTSSCNKIYFYSTWCPLCKNKTEGKLKSWLETKYKDVYKIIFQFNVNWCRNPDTNRYLPYDFCIKDLKIIISLDGRQHYEFVKFFHKHDCLENSINRDILKTVNALENGYSIIRIPQEYVWNDEYNWQDLLKSNIKNYDKPTVKFLDFNNEYDSHREKLKLIKNGIVIKIKIYS